MTPIVSFVVPCYKLAHLLRECVESILSQTYGDFEVLIMDDCSPDNTPEVAQSFQHPRVKYVRNDPNLGHLRNYNFNDPCEDPTGQRSNFELNNVYHS
jgi:glycosyltransferase involved in cell wall biosynthesis